MVIVSEKTDGAVGDRLSLSVWDSTRLEGRADLHVQVEIHT